MDQAIKRMYAYLDHRNVWSYGNMLVWQYDNKALLRTQTFSTKNIFGFFVLKIYKVFIVERVCTILRVRDFAMATAAPAQSYQELLLVVFRIYIVTKIKHWKLSVFL